MNNNPDKLNELSKIVIDTVKEAGNVEEMYFRAGSSVKRESDSQGSRLVLGEGGTVSFDTYFNCFSYAKYLRYTNVKSVVFELKLKGDFTVKIIRKTLLEQPRIHQRAPIHSIQKDEEIAVCRVSLKETGNWQYRVDMSDEVIDMTAAGELKEKTFYNAEERDVNPGKPKSAMYYIKVIAMKDDCVLYGGRYLTDCELSRKVCAALNICTFKREEYVTANVNKINENLLKAEDSSIKDNLMVFVVDNGQTLEGQLPESDKILRFPNRNYGGAGGFTRGIIEAYDRRDYITHVIMCDDDLYMDPHILEKMINFLKFLKPEYEELHIHGGMFSLSEPTFQTEASAMWHHGGFPHKPLEMREQFNLLLNDMEEPFDYTGWWLTCMPVSLVEKNGLPLPLFIKCDDMEYGIRNEENVLVMNGIGVWHEAFDKKYSAHLEYFFTRNDMVIDSFHDMLDGNRRAMKLFTGRVLHHLFMHRYESAYFKLRGMNDYLKGVDFFKTQKEDELLMDLLSHNMKQYTEEQLNEMGYKINLKKMRKNSKHKTHRSERFINKLTLYGNIIPTCLYMKKPSIVDMQNCDPCHFAFRKEVIMWNPGDGKGAVVKASVKTFWKYFFWLIATDIKLIFNGNRISRQFYKRGYELTTVEFWKEHLGLNGGQQ